MTGVAAKQAYSRAGARRLLKITERQLKSWETQKLVPASETYGFKELLALQTLFSEGRFSGFDFTEGEGQHKQLFSTQSCLCADVYVLSRRLRPVSLAMLHHTADRLSMAVGIGLDYLKLRSRLRRLVRS